MTSRILITILAPFLVAMAVLLVRPSATLWRGRLALLAPLTVLVTGIALWNDILPGHREVLLLPWIAELGLDVGFRVDRLGVFFVMLIGGIGLGIFQYARMYFGPRMGKAFWPLMLVFTGGMLGIVLSDNLVLLYVFWELTTVTSALLIATASDDAAAKKGALQAFLVTGAGGLALLAGIVLLGESAGTYSITALAGMADRIVADPGHKVALVLLLIGAFTKSAQVPFHFWLPGAMAAPAPVSAYLHSATMVKAGVFLIGRLFPVFSESPIWLPVLTTVGLTSFVLAGWNALWNDDVKKLLAYSTIAYLGLLVAHYGFAARAGLQGELVGIANHALYKSALFLLVGWVEKATGTRDLRTLSRERWPPREPIGTALFGLGALALAGSPLFLGFLSKELFLETVTGGSAGLLSQAVVVLAAALSVAYGLKIFTAMLFGSEVPPVERRGDRAKISRWLLIIPGVLLAPQVLAGLAPGFFLGGLVSPETHLPQGPAFWRHADVLLVISLLSFVVGGGLFLVWRQLLRAPHYPAAEQLVSWLANVVLRAAAALGRVMQSGGHPRFLMWTLGATTAALLATYGWRGPEILAHLSWGPEPLLGWVPAVAIAGASILVVVMAPRLTKVVMLALVGYGVAFYYVLFRAPDLVLTQILVETVSLVLLLLVFRRLPPLGQDERSAGTRVAHGMFSVVVGAAMTMLAWSAATSAASPRTGDEHIARSWIEAHGRNVVNVILVDFRGVDTMAETVVLVIAALGVISLMRVRARRQPGGPST